MTRFTYLCRYVTVWLLVVGLIDCGGQGSDPSSSGSAKNEPSGVAATAKLPASLSLGSASVRLRAVAHHDGRFEDATQTLPSPTAFRVPEALYVERGNAGNAVTTFRFRDEKEGGIVTCSYRGGAGIAHPTSEHDVLAGRRYRFASYGEVMLKAQPPATSSVWKQVCVKGNVAHAVTEFQQGGSVVLLLTRQGM